MKKNFRVIQLLLLLLVVCSFTSCKKLFDILHKDPVAVYKDCRISKMYQDEPGFTRMHVFSYNSFGDPVSIINDDPYEGAPQLYFRYDAHRKLTDYIGLDMEESDFCVFWYKYVYSAAGRVLRDTQWVFGNFGASPDPNSQFIRVSHYTYDASGRIASRSQQQIHPVVEAPFLQSYIYNISGNRNSALPYDDKLNLRRTNRVWMFLDKNYSLNNSPAAALYNGHSLPLKFEGAIDFTFLAYGGLGNSRFEYFCP